MWSGKRRPAAFYTYTVHHRRIVGIELICCFFRIFCNIDMVIDSHLQLTQIISCLNPCLFIELDKWLKLFRHTTYDRQHQGQSQSSSSCGRARGAASSNPDRDLFLIWSWIDAQVLKGGSMFSHPG